MTEPIMNEPTTVLLRNLLERRRRGDEQAGEELLAAAQKRLEQLTRKMFRDFGRVRRWEDTADVVQNATLRLWRALHEVQPETVADFLRLSAALIRRELIDLARHHFGPQGAGAHHRSWPRKPDDDRSPSPLDQAAPETDARQLAEWTEFHELVDKLPEEEKVAYDLLWYQELGQEEAAKLLDISVWTLRRHFRQAKLRLHGWLAEADSR